MTFLGSVLQDTLYACCQTSLHYNPLQMKLAHMETLHWFENDQTPWARPLRSCLQAPFAGLSRRGGPSCQGKGVESIEANSLGSGNRLVWPLSWQQFALGDSTRSYMSLKKQLLGSDKPFHYERVTIYGLLVFSSRSPPILCNIFIKDFLKRFFPVKY